MTKDKWRSVEFITVGELKRHLEVFGDDWIVDFSGLEFYRTKARGDNTVQIEFSEQVGRSLRTGLVEAESLDGPRSMRQILPGVE